MTDDRILRTQSDGRVLIVLPEGEVGGFMGEQVSLEVDDVLAEIDELAAKEVVVDFKNVPYFGSSLLAAITRIWKHMNRVGGQLAVCNVPEVGLDVLRVSRFVEVWPVYGSREEAKDALTSDTAQP